MKKGFTLIELLVTISIIGILSTLMIANFNSTRQRARDAQRKSDLRNIQTALRLYYNDSSGYPSAAVTIPFGAEWTNASGDTIYMNQVPQDPQYNSDTDTPKYTYTPVVGDTDTYTLSACLENKSDDKCDKDGGGNIVACNDGEGCLYTVKP
jgi:general secretion pathway protein G